MEAIKSDISHLRDRKINLAGSVKVEPVSKGIEEKRYEIYREILSPYNRASLVHPIDTDDC